MIRKAELQDSEKVAQLILMASFLVFEDMLKTNDYNKIIKFVMNLYDNIDNKYSMNNIIVYTIDDEVAGCLVYYKSKDEAILNKNMQKILNSDYSFSFESIPNTVYLDSIAVFDNFQGQGIARELIEYLKDNSDSDLSLLVETYKKKVQSFYERLGFEFINKVEIFNGELNSMIYKQKHK